MSQNLNLYNVFYTVAKCKNISLAAKALYISQPAVSKSINKLEQSLSTTLFIRSSKGVTLTSEGKILYLQLEKAFSSISLGEEQIRNMNDIGMGQISIGVSTTLCKYVLLPYLNRFIEENPHVKISIDCQATNQTIVALQNGSIDIGLIGEPAPSAKLEFYPIMEIQDIFVTTKSYIDNLKKRLGPDFSTKDSRMIVEEASFLMLNKENLTRQHIESFLMVQGLHMNQIIEVSTMDLLVEFAKINMGIACVIENFVTKELDEKLLMELHITAPIPSRKIGFSCLKSNQSALHKFIKD